MKILGVTACVSLLEGATYEASRRLSLSLSLLKRIQVGWVRPKKAKMRGRIISMKAYPGYDGLMLFYALSTLDTEDPLKTHIQRTAEGRQDTTGRSGLTRWSPFW